MNAKDAKDQFQKIVAKACRKTAQIEAAARRIEDAVEADAELRDGLWAHARFAMIRDAIYAWRARYVKSAKTGACNRCRRGPEIIAATRDAHAPIPPPPLFDALTRPDGVRLRDMIGKDIRAWAADEGAQAKGHGDLSRFLYSVAGRLEDDQVAGDAISDPEAARLWATACGEIKRENKRRQRKAQGKLALAAAGS